MKFNDFVAADTRVEKSNASLRDRLTIIRKSNEVEILKESLSF